MKEIKSDCSLYASLYIASQYRDGNLGVFSHENHAYPISLSEYGTLSKTDKADFLKVLNDIHPPLGETCVTAKAFVADGAVLVNMNAPKISKTYGEYADVEFIRSLNGVVKNASRFDCL